MSAPVFPNTNAAAARVLVETLACCGLRYVILSPGSRSTPLAMAFAARKGIEAIPVLDERSAGFFALGLARRTGRPVAVVCTSGTAAANYHPAVIEAAESGLSLLVLTADRPPEMRECSSGQTIDQVKLYGHYPRWQVELPVPEATETGLRSIRQTMVQAWRRTLDPVAGPVHVNIPYRDPLEPTEEVPGGIRCDCLEPADGFFAHLKTRIPVARSARLPRNWQRGKGLLIDGPGVVRDSEAHAVAVLDLARGLGWPILVDGVSTVRQAASNRDPVVAGYEVILRDPEARIRFRPERIICFGPLPTSKLLRGWLRDSGAPLLFVDPGDRNLDPGHGASIALRCEASQLRWTGTGQSPDAAWLSDWLDHERRIRRRVTRDLKAAAFPFEGSIVRTVGQTLRRGTQVFAANSMAIRNVEFFWPIGRGHRFACNRGANGIDGTLSTAIGLAHGGPPTWLLTGDLALLHDTNGFLSTPHFSGSLTILLINNEGGGIFEHLPVSAFDPPFEAFFAMPQSVDFRALARVHGVGYEQIRSVDALVAAARTRPEPGIRILEIRTDRKRDARTLRALIRGA